MKSKYGVTYEPGGEILITVGVSEAMDLAMRAIINPGDEVIMPEPYYVANPSCVILAGGTPVLISTRQEDGFEIDPKEIEKNITPRTKAVFLGYPSNPTGGVMPREKLQAIADLAEKHNLLVVSDEIYARLTYGAEHTCFSSLPGARERTILLGGFSKAWAMTGWRVGFAMAPKEIIAAMTKIHQ
jgi:aminotransferase